MLFLKNGGKGGKKKKFWRTLNISVNRSEICGYTKAYVGHQRLFFHVWGAARDIIQSLHLVAD
jgi:hypothetical protein